MCYICRTSSLPSFKLTLLSISSNDMTELDICSLEVFEEVALLLLFAISSIIAVFYLLFYVQHCILSMSPLQG